MNFTRRIDTVAKHLWSNNANTHYLRCTVCQSRQDFDGMTAKEAKLTAIEAGWREATDDDKEVHCLCPECVEEQEVTAKAEHDLELNSYD